MRMLAWIHMIIVLYRCVTNEVHSPPLPVTHTPLCMCYILILHTH